MKKYDLKTYFEKSDYNWEKDKEALETIFKFTKTRVKSVVPLNKFTYGAEQTFLIKAVIERYRAKNFFEIGTGRGTACYATSLVPSMEKVLTVDIVPFTQKRNEAIDFKPAFVSNEDLYNMIPYQEKEKISFIERKDLPETLTQIDYKFDVCFIDGDHTDIKTIIKDFLMCQKVMKDDGIIIWDDYDPEKFSVQKVVEKVLEKCPQYNAALVEFRGHLFDDRKERDAGIVLMSTREL